MPRDVVLSKDATGRRKRGRTSGGLLLYTLRRRATPRQSRSPARHSEPPEQVGGRQRRGGAERGKDAGPRVGCGQELPGTTAIPEGPRAPRNANLGRAPHLRSGPRPRQTHEAPPTPRAPADPSLEEPLTQWGTRPRGVLRPRPDPVQGWIYGQCSCERKATEKMLATPLLSCRGLATARPRSNTITVNPRGRK